jgi:acetyl-CoA carboxylase biotin carboxyl carrier protein
MAMPDEKPVESPSSGRVDVESIRSLLALMSEHGLVELEIEQEDLVVRLRKAGAAAPAAPVAVAAPTAPVAAVAAAPAAAAASALPTINSPMVGTFYATASPEAEAYVKVGDHVTEDTVVCMIEAMKVFNEIRAEMAGTVEKILAKNAQAVEFGQPLFVVRPD